ncbi:copper resistance CopC/CopD family protein [Actinoplanes sp. GCM10030250]|uniref:copper resistance CopC/CopD family protein n=1 Tax=Actinoplanes sp. GCM10030250 TaxID=3273376 RepID=UPI003612E870
MLTTARPLSPKPSLRRRTVWCLLAVVLGACVAVGLPAGPASAHAVLTAAVPQQGSVVPTFPEAVLLTFNESVRIVPGRTQVVGPDGKRLNAGDPEPVPGGLSIALRATDRPLGTYLVSFRVISGDSHPVSGSFTFSVGAPSAGAPQAVDAGVDPVVRVATSTAKYAGYLGVVLVIGPVLMLAWWYPRRLSRRPLSGLFRTGLAVIAVSTIAGIWLQAPASSGAGVLDVSLVELRDVLLSPFGAAMIARLLVVAAAAAVVGRVRRRPSRSLALVLLALAAGGLVTWPLTGHPAASPQSTVLVLADVVHLGAMGLWAGGLICLLVVLRRADVRELRVILPAWSRWAMIAVYWLIAAGVLQAVVQMGGWAELVDTPYGRLVLIKSSLVAVVLAVAAVSWRLVRRAGPATARTLRWTVGAEVAVIVGVLVATTALVQTNPGRTVDVEAEAAAKARGFATTLTSPLYAIQFDVFPAKVGEFNTLHAYVYTPEGKPLQVQEWKVTAALPAMGIEPMDNPVASLGANQGLGNLSFPFPGEWDVRLTLRVSEIDQATVTTTIPVS